jgi:DNA-binding NtrC family response regulator
MVADQGWRPLKASSISEAFVCLEHEEIDAIVSDWELDDGDGDVILRLASTAHQPPIPTVIISSYASAELAAQARAAGAIDLLAKPFRIEELTLLLSRQLFPQ